MSFPTPKAAVKAPVVPPVAPLPEISERPAEEAKRKRPRGRASTFLTGDLVPETQQKKLLG